MIPNRVIVVHDRLHYDERMAAIEYIDEVATTPGTGGLMGPIIRPPFPDPFNRIVPWIHATLLWHLRDVPAELPRGDAISLKLEPGVSIRRHNHDHTPAIGLYYFSSGAPLYIARNDDLDVWGYRGDQGDDSAEQHIRINVTPGRLVLMDGALEHWVDAQPPPDPRYAIAVVWRSAPT